MNHYLKSIKLNDIQRIIELADRCHQLEDELSTGNPDESLGEYIKRRMKDGPDLDYLALDAHIRGLTDEQKNELMAVMWIGRGGDGELPEDWADLIERAAMDGEPGKTAYMAGKSPLGDYLRAGLRAIGA